MPDLCEEWEGGTLGYGKYERLVEVVSNNDGALSENSQSNFISSVSFAKVDD